MTIIACGINYKTAPLAVREHFALTSDAVPRALQALLQHDDVEEAMLLSTCNRTEFYGSAKNPDFFARWLAKQQQCAEERLLPHWYLYEADEAVRHVFRVASGLDSMMTGEPQILGQMKHAYALARQQGGVGKKLQRLFQTVFSVSKQVRRDTAIGRCPVTVAFAATHLAKQIVTDLNQSNILLLGAGKLIELTAMHLVNHGAKRLIVANRSIDRAQEVAAKFLGHCITLQDVPIYLQDVDIIIAATAAESFLITHAMLEKALKLRKPRPLFVVDLSVPRNVEPTVAKLPDVQVYHIDDLQQTVQNNLQARAAAAMDAEQFIEMQVAHFMRKLKLVNVSDTICAFRDKMSAVRDVELQAALKKLANGENPQQVVTTLAKRLTNKWLHQPTHTIRQLVMDDRVELLILMKQLFDL